MIDLRSLTLKQLRALAATVRHGTVTGAAKELHVTPPAVTIQLKALENSVGAALFDRSTHNGFVPTAIGRELLEAAEDIERLIERASERILALRSGAAGSLVLGAVSTAKYVTPAIVAGFQSLNPDIRVKLIIGNRGDILRGIERSELDLVIMGRPPAEPPVVSTLLADHPHVMIAAPDHPLAGDDDISPGDLLRERILAREQGSGTRLLMDRFLDRFGGGLAFDIVEMGTNETIKQAVIARLGIAVISAHTCFSELSDGKLVALSLPGLPLVRQWFLIHRADRQLTPAGEQLRAFIVERRQQLFPRLGT